MPAQSQTLNEFPLAETDRSAKAGRGWLREPLLHFALIGGLLFAADHVLVSRTDDPRVIVIDRAEEEARRVFAASRGRDPDPDELKALQQVWLDNEVLYREGLALQVDKGDSAIRERVIFKALSVIDAGVKLPVADEKTLREWFEAHRDKYDEPARVDFEEAVPSGTAAESDIRAFISALNGGLPGDARAGLRVFKGRPRSNIVQSYGLEFANTLAALPVGEWRALQGKDGWRAVRLTGHSDVRAADFEAMRGPVLQDWADAAAAEQRTAAVRALAGKYQIVSRSPGK